MITKGDVEMLRRLSKGFQCGPLMDDRDIRLVQKLTNRGLARDFSNIKGEGQIEVRLRIWGITDAGRAVLEEQTFTSPRQQLPLQNVYPQDGEC